MGLALTVALVMNGMLAGMTIDQSIKQLPARRHIGASAFSRYSRAADLKNGVPLYAFFGIGAPLSCGLLAFAVLSASPWNAPKSLATVASLIFSAAQLGLTSRAAPTDFSQLKYDLSQEAELSRLFDRFQRLQSWRSVAILLAFAAVLFVNVSDGL